MSIVLFLHNLNRWIVLALLLIVLVRTARRHPAGAANQRLSLFLTIALDTQLLLGLLLYFVFSSLTRSIWTDFAAGMSQPAVRFFGLEHALYGLMAVVLAHVGRAQMKKADDNARRRALLFYALTLLVLLVGIPWSRPLLPHF